MNKILSSAFAAVLVFATTAAFAQGANATRMGKGHGIANNTTVSTNFSTNGKHTGPARASMCSPAVQAHNNAFSTGASSHANRVHVQERYMVRAVVVPINGAFDAREERYLKVAAPTKSAALARMRQEIDAIGVPVRILRMQLTAL